MVKLTQAEKARWREHQEIENIKKILTQGDRGTAKKRLRALFVNRADEIGLFGKEKEEYIRKKVSFTWEKLTSEIV